MQPSRNIAARAGRWSARHRKTAILGWIAVRRPRLHGGRQRSAPDTLTQEQSGVGESGRADRIVDGRLPRQDRRDGAHPEQEPQDRRPGVPGRRRRRQPAARRDRRASTRSTVPTARTSQRDLGRRALRAAQLRDPGRRDEDAAVDARSSTTTVAAVDGRREGASRPSRRAVRRGQLRGRSSWRSSTRDLKKADDDVAADHAAHPARRVRRAGGRGHPAAAGDHRRRSATMGLVGPLSQLTPVEESINHVILLIGLAVGVDYALFYLRRVREERAAGRSTEAAIEAAAATSGRAVLDLRHHGHDRDGRHVLRRRRDVHVVRHRHHRRRRRRDARLAHRAARPAVAARRPHRQGPRSRASTASSAARAVVRPLVARRRPRHAPPAAVGGRCRSRCSSRWRIPALGMETGTPAIDTLPQDLAVVAEVQPPPGRVPERDLVARRRHQGRGRHRAGRDRRRSQSWSRPTRAAHGPVPGRGPFEQDVNPDKTVNDARRWGSPATAGRRVAARRSTCSATTSSRRRSARSTGSRPTATGGTAVGSRLQRLDDVAPAARVRRS